MADIATLGLQVDSRPVAAAKTELTGLAAAAKAAETSTGALEAAAKRAGASVVQISAGARKATIDFQALINASTGVSGSLTAIQRAARAADIQAYGKQLDDVRAKYNPLFAAGRQYRQELTDIKQALKVGAINQTEYAAAITNAKVNFVQQVNAIRPGRDALAESAAAAGRAGAGFKAMSFEARNLGYQLVDVTQGALMGQSAFQIFAQQGGQVAQVIATSPGGLGGLLKELGKSFAGLLTPMRLLGTAALVAGVAGYALYSSWKTTTLQFDDTSRAIGTTINELRGLERAASSIGIEDLAKDAEKFAGSVYQARNGMGSLGDVLRANGERASDFISTLEAAARVIQRATSDQQRLQLLRQMGLPVTMEWVRFLSQGADAIRQAATEGGNLSAAEREMVEKARQFDEEWKRAWKNFGQFGRDAIVETKGWLDWLSFKGNEALTKLGADVGRNLMKAGQGVPLKQDFGSFYDAVGIKRPSADKAPVDPEVAKNAISKTQQYLSLLGQTASVEQQVLAVRKQLELAALNGVGVSARERDTLLELTRQRALGIDTIRAQADAYRVESATVGMSIEQAATFTAVQQRLNEARRNGQILTAAQVAEIEREATALGRAAGKADELRFGYDTFSGTMREFGQNLRNGQNGFRALGNAGVSALGKIADRLMDMASRGLWNAAFGGGGSIFGSLFGGGSSGPNLQGGVWPAANGHVFSAPGLSAFSGQIVTRPTMFPINDGPIRVQAFAKGAGLMGEAGPEAVMPLTRTPDGKLGVRSSAGGGAPGVVVQQTNNYTFTGVEPGMEARLKRYIDEGDKRAKSDAIAAVPEQRRKSPATYLRDTR